MDSEYVCLMVRGLEYRTPTTWIALQPCDGTCPTEMKVLFVRLIEHVYKRIPHCEYCLRSRMIMVLVRGRNTHLCSDWRGVSTNLLHLNVNCHFLALRGEAELS
jgi:hypothetical protein